MEKENKNEQEFKRPTSIEEMKERLQNFCTIEGWNKGLSYKPDPTDVFIVTPPKCGTTWTQQIVHGLRTRGSMDFDEITRVIPWIEMAHDMGLEIEGPQVAKPKAFKSHSCLDKVPQGGKYIVVIRHPHDAFLSDFRFCEGMFFEKGSIKIEEYVKVHLEEDEVIRHILALWPRRKDLNVLPLCYENMKEDLPGTIERIAKFIGIPLDPELKEIVLRQSDIKFMQEHREQFEDQILRATRSAAMRLPLDGRLYKVRNGNIGEGKINVPDEVKNIIDKAWEERITSVLGLKSYDDFRKEISHLAEEKQK